MFPSRHIGTQAPSAETASAPTRGGPCRATAPILVVDDDADIRAILTTALQEAGYNVVSVRDGRKALEWVRDFPPDLILLDMMMPVLSSYDAVAALRANPASAGIPVIGISAKTTLEDIEQASQSGIDACISKPFRLAQILQMVETHIGEHLDRSPAE